MLCSLCDEQKKGAAITFFFIENTESSIGSTVEKRYIINIERYKNDGHSFVVCFISFFFVRYLPVGKSVKKEL